MNLNDMTEQLKDEWRLSTYHLIDLYREAWSLRGGEGPVEEQMTRCVNVLLYGDRSATITKWVALGKLYLICELLTDSGSDLVNRYDRWLAHLVCGYQTSFNGRHLIDQVGMDHDVLINRVKGL